MQPASSSDLASLSSYHQVSKKVLLKALVWEFQNLSSEFQSDIIARYLHSRSESISFLVDKGKASAHHVQQRKRKRTRDYDEHRSRRTTG